MKGVSLNLSHIKLQARNLRSSILKYHLIIALLAVSSFLIFSVITVSAILSGTQDIDYAEEQQANAVKTKFDDSTIQKINELRSREENPSLDLPDNGRRNPFRE